MRIRAGYSITYECQQPTPMVLMLSVHPSRMPDLAAPHYMTFDPPIAARDYPDDFDNVCTRIIAPPGRLTIATDFVIGDPGAPDVFAPGAQQVPVQDLPDDVLIYLLGSRYCDTDHLSGMAWSMFGAGPTGWGRVQAICDYVHQRLTFGYQHASAMAHGRDATDVALSTSFGATRLASFNVHTYEVPG